jgi:phosphopantetheine adenylyltransferase
LKEIPLQPKMLTDEDFYNQMVEEEKQRKTDGYEERVNYLNNVLEMMKTCHKMAKATSIDDLFP